MRPFIADQNYFVIEPADVVVVRRGVGSDMKGRLAPLRLKWNAGAAYRYGLFRLMEEEWETLETA
jgi:hypothetical protein